MSRVVIWLIKLYQRYISPYKGFRCAYGALYHKGSCSHRIKEIVHHKGVYGGWCDIRAQFQACTLAYEILQTKQEKRQDGTLQHCECGCDLFASTLEASSCDAPCACSL